LGHPVYADADELRDARPINHVVRHTELDTKIRSLDNERRSIFKAVCYTDQQLSVVSTYVYGEAQTPLGRFVNDTVDKLEMCDKA